MTRIKTINIFFSLLVMNFLSSCNGQVKTKSFKQETTSSPEKSKRIKSKTSNDADNIHSIIQDREGFIWFATTGDGVFRFNGNTFTNFTTENGLNSNCIFSIIQDDAGIIWFGTENGLSSFDRKKFKNYTITLSENTSINLSNTPTKNIGVSKILQAKNGVFWLATESGVYCYSKGIFTRFINNTTIEKSNTFYPKNVVTIIEDSKGNIWFTTRAEGIYCFNGSKISNYQPNNETWFFGLFEDKNGNVWAGSRESGVFRFDCKTFTKQFKELGFNNAVVYSITQDVKGNIWFGSDENKGLWSYDGTTLKNFNTKQGLTNSSVFCVFEDKSGKIWVGARNTSLNSYDGKTFTNYSE